MNLRVLRCLVRSRDTGEIFDFSRSGLFVQALGVALLNHMKRGIDENLDETKAALLVDFAGDGAISTVRRYEGGHRDTARIREQLRNLANAPDVLIPRLLIEAEIFVETETHVVAVQAIAELVHVQQMLLQGTRDGRLAACAEAREPYCHALLLKQLGAFCSINGTGVEDDVRRHCRGKWVTGAGHTPRFSLLQSRHDGVTKMCPR